MYPIIENSLVRFQENEDVTDQVMAEGQSLYENGQVLLLSQGKNQIEVVIDDTYEDALVSVSITEGSPTFSTKGKKVTEPQHVVASLLRYNEELERSEGKSEPIGKSYTREGMIRRVMAERQEKAKKADYSIRFADNPYGQHDLYNEKGQVYQVTFHDLVQETGYCSCPDYRTNKLGTCKHLMHAYLAKKGDKNSLRAPRKPFPFVEIGLDPHQDYRIRWFHPNPENIAPEIISLLQAFFGESTTLPEEEDKIRGLLAFTHQAEKHKQILIRPEVYERIERAFQRKILEQVSAEHQMDLSVLKAQLYPYQKRGVEFAAYRDGVIIADEMGLGKTLQAIATALVKKDAFGFTKTLIICPASLKDQWKNEIEKFTNESATIIAGNPEEREQQYRENKNFFLIINYETVLRDFVLLNELEIDFIILDEAQRIKNYNTITARSIKRLQKQHSLVITGTPIENRLVDLVSIMDFVDPHFLTPLWEFSYQYCYFDPEKKNKITGYHNLQALKSRLEPIILRRTKREVIQELPQVTQLDIPVPMHPDQANYHAGYAKGVGKIIKKKFLTAFDINRLMMLLNKMRMVCDSTFLIDQKTFISPKLTELRHLLTEKLSVQENDVKIIIFSEWTRMNGLIGKLLRELDITFVELSGKVPIAKRQTLVDKFYTEPECKVFLSTEAGGTGLNLQIADTVINFELPWNPAKKNQRIGRIDRIGQKADRLTVINFITRDSIEMRIASGLLLKESLFENVLDQDSSGDVVDFSQKGRSQFLKELTEVIEGFENVPQPDPDEEIEGAEFILDSPTEDIDKEPVATPELEKETAAQMARPESEVVHSRPATQSPSQKQEEMAEVMNKGMSFLAGMFKMMTGKEIMTQDQSIQIDPETNEVVMRFKMPG